MPEEASLGVYTARHGTDRNGDLWETKRSPRPDGMLRSRAACMDTTEALIVYEADASVRA